MEKWTLDRLKENFKKNKKFLNPFNRLIRKLIFKFYNSVDYKAYEFIANTYRNYVHEDEQFFKEGDYILYKRRTSREYKIGKIILMDTRSGDEIDLRPDGIEINKWKLEFNIKHVHVRGICSIGYFWSKREAFDYIKLKKEFEFNNDVDLINIGDISTIIQENELRIIKRKIRNN